MRYLLAIMLLASVARADPPFYPRGLSTNQSVGGLNGNFIDENTLRHDQLNKALTPKFCPSGQALTGAFYHQGYVFGGTCSSVSGGGGSGVTQIIAGTNITISPVGGTGIVTINSTDFGPSTAALSASTIALAAQDQRIALSTTALSASTVAIISILNTVGASTTTLSASTVSIVGILNAIGASTTTLSASTVTIISILNTVGASTTTLSVSTVALAAQDAQIALATGTLSASTVAIRGILDVVGASTSTLSASTFALNASTISLAAQDQRIALSTTAVSLSTVALNLSTIALAAQYQAIALSTTAVSLSTVALNLSTIALAAQDQRIALSTTALSASTGAIQSQLNVFESTAGPLIGTLGQSTASIQSAFSAYVSTNGPLVTALAVSTGNLYAVKLSTGVQVPTALLDFSTITSRFVLVEASTGNLYSTKLSTGTQVPTALLDFSTITTALAGKQASFTGVSSSCASGFYWNSGVWVNGVQTGGSCTASGGGSSSSMTITAVSDNFIGSVTGSQKVFTLSQTPANAAALTCILNGLLLSQTSDYTYTPPSTIAITTAPAANSTGFFCNYFVNTSTIPAAFILNSSQTVSGSSTFSGLVSVSSGIAGTINRSSFTFLPGGIFTQSTLSTCLISSTVTFATTGGVDIKVSFSGTVSNNSTQESDLSFLMDGNYVSPMSANVSAVSPSPISTQCQTATFAIRIPSASITAGSHSFCLTGKTQSAVNFTIVGTTTKCPYQSIAGNATQFGAEEVH